MRFLRRGFIDRSLTDGLEFLRHSLFADEIAGKPGFLQRRDPRIKIAATVLFLVLVLYARSIPALAAMYALCIALALLSSVRVGYFLKRTWLFIPLFSLAIAVPAVFSAVTPGATVARFDIFGLTAAVTRQGLESAGFFILRVLVSVSLAVLLTLTTRHHELLAALRCLRVPPLYVMTLGMCYRYIHLLIGLFQNMHLSVKSRAGGIDGAVRGQGIVAWKMGALWQRSYLMQEQVYAAMKARGYDGEPRTLARFRTGPADWAFLGFAAFLTGVSLWIR